VTRRAGADRYATAVSVSIGAFSSAKVAYLAVGTNFPDALAGGPPAAISGAPMLLVASDNLPTIVRSELQRLGVERVVVLGGTGTISNRVVSQLEALLD
jgi:putative cell wall-binding protein